MYCCVKARKGTKNCELRTNWVAILRIAAILAKMLGKYFQGN